MENCKEQVINTVIINMQDRINSDDLRYLDNVLHNALYHFSVDRECTELSTSLDDNEYILRVFAANKKLEGCKENSIEQYVSSTRKFLEIMNKNYKQITKDDVRMYLALYSRDHKQNSVCNLKKFLSAFFAWVSDEGYIDRNPVRAIKGIKPEEIENSALSIEEELALRDVAERRSARDRAIIDLLLSTGLRVSEVRGLNRSDVNLSDGSVTFRSAKSYKFRTVYLDARAKKHLFEYLSSRKDCCEALFATSRAYRLENGSMDAKRMSKAAFETITKSVGKSADIKQKCTVHVLRKTFATRLADRGCPLEVIQELLGHADPGTTSKNYVAKSKNRVKRACEQYLFAA